MRCVAGYYKARTHDRAYGGGARRPPTEEGGREGLYARQNASGEEEEKRLNALPPRLQFSNEGLAEEQIGVSRRQFI